MTFGEALAQLVFGTILNIPVAWSAIHLARSVRPRRSDRMTFAATTLVFGVALVVLIVTLGGVLGMLDRFLTMLVLAWAASGMTAWVAARLHRGPAPVLPASPLETPPRRYAVPLAAALTLLAWIPLAFDRMGLPPVAWDSLTYHLQFPVLWLQTGHPVTSVPAIGDPAHTYYPLNGEMLLYWMLLSTGSDLLSFATQMPFALLGSWAVGTIAFRCGARRQGAVLAALAWLGTPALLRQSVEPLVDVEAASLFLAAIAFGFASRPRDGAVRFLPAAAALGLLVGMKYSGVLFALAAAPALALASWRHGNRRSLLVRFVIALSAIAILGGYAYLRNTTSGGMPFLPVSVSVGGRPIGMGSLSLGHYFGPSARRIGWRELLVSTRSVLELGPAFAALVAGCLIGLRIGVRRGGPAGRRLAVAAGSGLLAFGLAALLLPFREHRYFFGVTGISWSVVAALARDRRASVALAFLVPALLLVQLPLTLLYWGKDLALAGLTMRHVAGGIALVVLAVAVGLSFKGGRNRRVVETGPPWRPPRWIHATAAVAALLLVSAATSMYEGRRFAAWERYWGTRYDWGHFASPRQDMTDIAASWEFLADATRRTPSVVAYAGSNLPYPLSGYGRRNRVLFAPRNQEEHAWRFAWGDRPPDPWSGGDAEHWRRNLQDLHVRYLCVYRQLEADDPQARFPVERAWAEQGPQPLKPIWQRTWVRIYEVGSASHQSADTTRSG